MIHPEIEKYWKDQGYDVELDEIAKAGLIRSWWAINHSPGIIGKYEELLIAADFANNNGRLYYHLVEHAVCEDKALKLIRLKLFW